MVVGENLGRVPGNIGDFVGCTPGKTDNCVIAPRFLVMPPRVPKKIAERRMVISRRPFIGAAATLDAMQWNGP